MTQGERDRAQKYGSMTGSIQFLEELIERQHPADVLVNSLALAVVERVAQEEIQDLPDIDIPLLLTSVGNISRRLRGISRLTIFFSDLFSWKRPAFTLSALVIYTWLCKNPRILGCAPPFLLLAFKFVPGHVRRYPVGNDVVRSQRADDDARKLASSNIARIGTGADSRNMLHVFRKGQHALNNISQGIDRLDDLLNDKSSFEDPRESSALVFVLLATIFFTAWMSRYIPPSNVFIVSGWTCVLYTHPTLKTLTPKIRKVKEKLFKKPTTLDRVVAWLKPQFDDEELPLVRQVEVFEFQNRGASVKFSRKSVYLPLAYTPHTDQLLVGVTELVDVDPPVGWSFCEDSWVLDTDAFNWVTDRGIEALIHKSWAVDPDGDWRRRRWTRMCSCKSVSAS